VTLKGSIFIVMDYEIKASIEMDITPIASFNWGQDYAIKLRQCRESAGLSRAKLSEITGIAEGYKPYRSTSQTFFGKSLDISIVVSYSRRVNKSSHKFSEDKVTAF
jgi:hypothetical protein